MLVFFLFVTLLLYSKAFLTQANTTQQPLLFLLAAISKRVLTPGLFPAGWGISSISMINFWLNLTGKFSAFPKRAKRWSSTFRHKGIPPPAQASLASARQEGERTVNMS